MDIDSIMSMNCEALRGKLRELGLDTTGLKTVLRDRLLRHYGHQTVGDDDESLNSVYQDLGTGASAGVRPGGPVFTLKDIVDSLSTFSGTDSYDVRDWISEFEENAEIVGWNNIQKFIYAKQLLKGAARLFVRSQSGLKSWDSLKDALIDEFGENLSSVEIHRKLRNRRKNANETYREYLYALMEIGKPINLDVPSLLEYFVEGIPDSRFNKAILYQAKTIEQMKENIKIYEKICTSNKDAKKFKVTHGEDVKEGVDRKMEKKNCFKCGSSAHLAKDCNETQFKCFKCNQSGHRATDCKVVKLETKQERSTVNTVDFNREPTETGLKFKKIAIGDLELYGLIDTGCGICIIRSDIYDKIRGKFPLVPEQQRLKGAGSGVFYTLGYFEAPISLDGIPLRIIFHVVQVDDLDYPAVIGTNLLQFGDLIIREDGVEFVPKDKGNARESDRNGQGCTSTSKVVNVNTSLVDKVDKLVDMKDCFVDEVVQDGCKLKGVSIRNEEEEVQGIEDTGRRVVVCRVTGKSEEYDEPLSTSSFPLPVISVVGNNDNGKEYYRYQGLGRRDTGKANESIVLRKVCEGILKWMPPSVH